MTKAEFVNELIEKIHPWFRLTFVIISDMAITLRIGATLAVAEYDHMNERWMLIACGPSDSERHFIESINLVMQGYRRDDSGVLHAP